MYQSAVPTATAGTARTALALVAIFSLLLSLFAIARPVIANHDDGMPEVPGYRDVSRENQGGNIESCLNEDATFVDFPSVDNTDDSGSASGSIDGDPYTLNWTIDSAGELTFEVTGALVEEVFVKGGPATTIYDYSGGPNSGTFPGPGIAHDDGLDATEGGISNLGFCLIPIPEGSIEVLKVGETQNPLPGAEFSVEGREGTFTTGEDGTFCVDGFDLGTEVDVTEVTPPAGYNPADPATQTHTVDVEGTCDERGDAGPDLTFANTLIEGSIEVLKVGETQNPLPGAEFSVEGREGTFTTGEDGTFCVDGFDLGTEVDVTEVTPPAGYNPADPATQTHTVDVEGTCDERGDAGPDLTFANTLIEEDRGSITVVKEIDCDECDTRTIGYYFNRADRHSEETNALFGAGIEADGILFTTVDQVQAYIEADISGESDGQNGLSARGQLTIQFLAASLNVERNGDDCELATRIYNNSESPFDGWTVQKILDEAELAFDGTSEYSDEEIKDALDDINNSSQADENPLTCEGSESGTLDGVTFDLFTQADFESDPQGDPIDSQTTENGGVAFFGDLELEVTYVLEESGFPEGVTCLIVGVEGGDAEVIDGVVYVTLTAESLDANLNLTITVENDCEEEQEEEVGSLLIAKTDEAGESLGGATFTVDGIEHADTDEDGFVCVDGLTLGDTVSVEETVAPDGFIGEEGAQDVPVLSDEDCATRLAGEDPQVDADITFVNVAEEEEDEFGQVEIRKDADDDADEPFAFSATWENGEFTLMDGDAEPSGDLLAGSEVTVTETLTEAQIAAGWSLEDIDCGEADVMVEGNSVTITVEANATIVCTFTNELEEEGEGIVEIDKLFCFTDGEASTEFIVFEPIFPETLGTQGVDEGEQPEEGCWTQAVSFTITGGDLSEPLMVMTEENGSIEFSLPESENAYVITEDITGESAEFFVEDGALTAIVVLNLVEVEEDTGLLKVIKLFCESDEATVEFSVEGGDAPVPVISGCEVGDATFELGDDTFSVGEDGIALLVVEVGEYTFAEVDPNEAEYDGTITIDEGEITTVIVINTFVEDELGGGGTSPDTDETPREGTAGGNPLPDTATLPIPGGSVPAALLALAMLSGLGAAGYAMATEARRRR